MFISQIKNSNNNKAQNANAKFLFLPNKRP